MWTQGVGDRTWRRSHGRVACLDFCSVLASKACILHGYGVSSPCTVPQCLP